MIVVGGILSLFCYKAIELSTFIAEFEKGCNTCEKQGNCIAWRKTSILKYDLVNQWMLVVYLMLQKSCHKAKRCPLKQKVICFLFCFCLYIITFWSKGIGLPGMLYGIAAMALFFLSIVDWNTQYIPLEISGIVFLCGLVHLYVDLSNWLDYIIGLIAVSGFLLLVNFIATPVLKKRYEDELAVDAVIGDGDIKLMAATGLLLGWKLNFIALGIGCVAGSVIHLILMKVKGSGRQFALGPYLSLGVYITMICGEQLISWYLNAMGVIPY